ncbi:hypothetical protein H0194_04705 [Corynebacterium incognita]|uniref:Uncharacterized protein n=1 Tax=Corynebacterium incognita TaxID=2754725 RepID=A0A7G7CRR5_9CORY|nr:hypothetical protein [Corynebacterium incognita]QNE90281.1 hypothetical protein H0194_04705 [Corynebacterium incognita]
MNKPHLPSPDRHAEYGTSQDAPHGLVETDGHRVYLNTNTYLTPAEARAYAHALLAAANHAEKEQE